MSRIRPGDRVINKGGVKRVVGRVVEVRHEGLLVSWGGPLGARWHKWVDVGLRFRRLPRAHVGAGVGAASRGR